MPHVDPSHEELTHALDTALRYFSAIVRSDNSVAGTLLLLGVRTSKVCKFVLVFTEELSSAERQKGGIADQRCSVESQKGAIAIDFVQQYSPSGSQRNIFELQ